MIEENICFEGKSILITGIAGFIGSHLARYIANSFDKVLIVGIDNMNSYYSVELKEKRLDQLKDIADFHFVKGDIADKKFIDRVFSKFEPDIVVNLAAQAGVRYSIESPDAYIKSNIIGFFNILEACRHSYDNGKDGVRHLVYASSSSVYGLNDKMPYSTDDKTDTPVSLYAATKKSDEELAHAYSKLYNIPCTGMRFFTVYGPAGRPDMAYFSFTDKLVRGEKIKLYNYGNCSRDFTYIDDIVEGITKIMQCAPERHDGVDGLPVPPYRLYNIGKGHPERLMDFVTTLCGQLINVGMLPVNFNIEEHIEHVPMQQGDVVETYADTKPLETDFGYKPETSLQSGLGHFARWYAEYYKVTKQ